MFQLASNHLRFLGGIGDRIGKIFRFVGPLCDPPTRLSPVRVTVGSTAAGYAVPCGPQRSRVAPPWPSGLGIGPLRWKATSVVGSPVDVPIGLEPPAVSWWHRQPDRQDLPVRGATRRPTGCQQRREEHRIEARCAMTITHVMTAIARTPVWVSSWLPTRATASRTRNASMPSKLRRLRTY